MKSLTVCMITARKEPHFEWFFDSLIPQIKPGDKIEIILVDLHKYGFPATSYPTGIVVRHVEPKPSVYQGKHRLTKQDHWDIAGAKNTSICLCTTEWIAWADDRCVLGKDWLQAVRDAMKGDYAVCGSYEKRFGMKVENGRITCAGEITGVDPRRKRLKPLQATFGGEWFGCTYAVPLEWALEMNGHNQNCASIGLEDVIFGNMLSLNGHTTRYDPRMHLIEDRPRDPGEGMPVRYDKGPVGTDGDKSHAVLNRFGGDKFCQQPINLRHERERVLRGEPWEIFTQPDKDFYDGTPLSEM